MPCMPARRDLHTGRPNFLHRSWGPIEPFDDSMPEMLKTSRRLHAPRHRPLPLLGRRRLQLSHPLHLVGVQPRPGGGPVEGRGQGPRAPRLRPGPRPAEEPSELGQPQVHGHAGKDAAGGDFRPGPGVHRDQQARGQLVPPDRDLRPARALLHPAANTRTSIPTSTPAATTTGRTTARSSRRTAAPSSTCATSTPRCCRMCDEHLGRVLAAMDEQDLWKDTMLIVCTDHGFLLGEHDWWGKNRMPLWNEIAHMPLFVWDPRCGESGRAAAVDRAAHRLRADAAALLRLRADRRT